MPPADSSPRGTPGTEPDPLTGPTGARCGKLVADGDLQSREGHRAHRAGTGCRTPILVTGRDRGSLQGDLPLPAERMQVPASALNIVEIYLAEQGIPSVGIWAQVPHYIQGTFFPGALALVERAVSHLGVHLSVEPLIELAKEQRARLDSVGAERPEARAYVDQLEAAGPPPLAPPGEDLAPEIERFPRDATGGNRNPFDDPPDDAPCALGAALMCSGTHPFSHWVRQAISPDPRYRTLVERMQWPARQLQIFGVHVHVGVRSAEKAVAISNALCAYIPHFLALSASSPFWLGQDTGLASSRAKIFELLPTAVLPYQLSRWSEFEEFMTTLVAARAIDTIREVWWDIRPHPDFGTVELRIFDGLPTLSEVAAIAALSQSLVEWMDSLADRGFALPHPRQWVVRENKWRAARYGVDAEIIVD